VIEQHYRHCLEVYGPRTGPRMMFRFGIKYATMHPTPKIVRGAFALSSGKKGFEEVLDTHYS
jgi:hypothetical protein